MTCNDTSMAASGTFLTNLPNGKLPLVSFILRVGLLEYVEATRYDGSDRLGSIEEFIRLLLQLLLQLVQEVRLP